MKETSLSALLNNAELGPAPLHPKFKLDEPLHPVQIAGFRKMTPAEKFEQLAQMYLAAIASKETQLRTKHPERDAEQVRQEARLAVMYAPE